MRMRYKIRNTQQWSVLVQSSKMNNSLGKGVKVTMKKVERTTIISVKIHHKSYFGT